MDIAFCYEKVLPARGGCATYITDLAQRLVRDGHDLHLYASSWEAAALPPTIRYHRLPVSRGPRFLKPWRFAAACASALSTREHQVSVGFDKTWGQDILYPQGGLHAASAEHNLNKYRRQSTRALARVIKGLDLGHWSFSRLERRQYLGPDRPVVLVNSHMVAQHFERYYGIAPERVRVLPSAIDPGRFSEHDRPRRRLEWRQRWGIGPEDTLALFVAMNYRLKGLAPLLHAMHLLRPLRLRLLVVGDPRIGRYQRLARRLKIADRVRFIGPSREVKNCYFASDFLVHPTFYDPCSLAVLEAMACGLPVITTRYCGASEFVSPPREGFVITDPHNHAELAECMARLLDPVTRASCAQAAQRAAARWTFEHHYRQLLQIFEEVAARRQAARCLNGAA